MNSDMFEFLYNVNRCFRDARRPLALLILGSSDYAHLLMTSLPNTVSVRHSQKGKVHDGNDDKRKMM